jgi:hypothetical protein
MRQYGKRDRVVPVKNKYDLRTYLEQITTLSLRFKKLMPVAL